MEYNCCVIDSDLGSISSIQSYINQTKGLNFVPTNRDPHYALQQIASGEQVLDITFLDITAISSANLIDDIKNKTCIVIITDCRQFAVEAFALNCCDYILKPYSYDRFLIAIEKVKEKTYNQLRLPYCFIPGDKKGVKLKVVKNEVLYVQSFANYIKIVTHSRKFMTYLSLGDMLQLLSDTNFLRIHRSYIVNTSKVNMIDPVSVYMENNVLIPIGPSYKAAFLSYLNR